jgi:outer membrane murein-binding lipoprotein Lpp
MGETDALWPSIWPDGPKGQVEFAKSARNGVAHGLQVACIAPVVGVVLRRRTSMNEYVTRSEWNEMKTILERIETKLSDHDRYFVAIRATFVSTDQRFEERMRHQGILHERLEKKVDTVIEVLDTKASASRVEALEVKVDALDVKVDALDVKVDALDAKVDALDAKVDTLGSKLDAVIELVRK